MKERGVEEMDKKVIKINQLQDKLNKTTEKLTETDGLKKHYLTKLKEEEKEKKELMKVGQDMKARLDKLGRENTELRQGMVSKEKGLIETVKSLKVMLKDKDDKCKELKAAVKAMKVTKVADKKEKRQKDADSSWSEDEMTAGTPNLFGS